MILRSGSYGEYTIYDLTCRFATEGTIGYGLLKIFDSFHGRNEFLHD